MTKSIKTPSVYIIVILVNVLLNMHDETLTNKY